MHCFNAHGFKLFQLTEEDESGDGLSTVCHLIVGVRTATENIRSRRRSGAPMLSTFCFRIESCGRGYDIVEVLVAVFCNQHGDQLVRMTPSTPEELLWTITCYSSSLDCASFSLSLAFDNEIK